MLEFFFTERGLLRTITRSHEKQKTQTNGLISDLLQSYFFFNYFFCLLYTSDAADEEDSVDLGGRRILKSLLTDNTKSGGSCSVNYYWYYLH